MKRIAALVAVLTALVAPVPTLAWGSAGHLMINRIGAEQLPATVPAFVRTREAVDEIATLGAEEDRLKGAGGSWDADFDPGHFLDLDDAVKIAGVVDLTALPPTMEAYAAALAAQHTDPYRMGFLPYSILDGFERVRKDFAIWRVDAYLAAHATTTAARERYARDRALREALTVRDIGVWGHFVGDGSQPLHVTVHYNDRGAHAGFESAFVSAHVSAGDVRPRIGAYHLATPLALMTQEHLASLVGTYLRGSASGVAKVYELWDAGAFAQATPAAKDFAAAQLARGASMFRDLITLAWDDSLNQSVGYPPVQVRQILQGTVVPRDPAD